MLHLKIENLVFLKVTVPKFEFLKSFVLLLHMILIDHSHIRIAY